MLADTGNYWEVSDILLSKIEGSNYLENKKRHIDYLRQNPYAARKCGINLFWYFKVYYILYNILVLWTAEYAVFNF